MVSPLDQFHSRFRLNRQELYQWSIVMDKNVYLLSGWKILALICVYTNTFVFFLLGENLKVFGCSPISPSCFFDNATTLKH